MDRVFSFLLWPKHEARGPWKQGRKKRGSITCHTDRANEANKMFIIWLCWLFGFWEGDRELEVRTATYRPGIDQSQHTKSVSHIINFNILLAFYYEHVLCFLCVIAYSVAVIHLAPENNDLKWSLTTHGVSNNWYRHAIDRSHVIIGSVT